MNNNKLFPGFYEQVINEYFAKQLEQVENRFKEIEPIDQTEATTVLSKVWNPQKILGNPKAM